MKVTTYDELIIKRLLDYLQREGINQVELANRLGWSAQDVNNILKGRSPLGKARLLHVKNKLGISIADTTGEEPFAADHKLTANERIQQLVKEKNDLKAELQRLSLTDSRKRIIDRAEGLTDEELEELLDMVAFKAQRKAKVA